MRTLHFFVFCVGIMLIGEVSAFAFTPDWLWAASISDIGNERTPVLSMDSFGNTYIAGTFNSPTLRIGTTTLTNSTKGATTKDDVFLAKFDADGTVVWAMSIGSAEDEVVHNVSTDQEGNVYVCGIFFGKTLQVGKITLSNTTPDIISGDIYLAKYSPTGELLWATSAGGLGNDNFMTTLTNDKEGNVYISGGFYALPMTVGDTTLQNAGTCDMFIIKYNSLGKVQWARAAGGVYDEYGISSCTDSEGNLYIVGFTASPSITIGTQTLYKKKATTAHIMVLIKYSPTGEVLWIQSIENSSIIISYFVRSDNNDNIYLTGSFADSTLRFGSYTLRNTPPDTSKTLLYSTDVFLVKFNAAGTVLWATSAGGRGHDLGMALYPDNNGNLYGIGSVTKDTTYFSGQAPIEPQTGGYDFYIVKYSSDAKVLWSTKGGCKGISFIYASTHRNNSIAVAGVFSGASAVLGNRSVSGKANNNSDIILSRFTDRTTSVDDAIAPNSITLYPHPASGVIHLSNIAAEGTISIHSLLGQCLYEAPVHSPEITIDLSTFPQGVYWYTMRTVQGVVKKGSFVRQE